MLFGVLSLLMGHWSEFFAKICIKSSTLDSRFYPCAPKVADQLMVQQHMIVSSSKYSNNTVSREAQETNTRWHDYCPEVYPIFLPFHFCSCVGNSSRFGYFISRVRILLLHMKALSSFTISYLCLASHMFLTALLPLRWQ